MIDGAWLVMSQGPQPGQTFMLDRDWLTIGRDPSNDIVISDPQVSRQHARITRQGKMMVIEDVGSTNGTFANGVRLTGPHVLSNGDVVGLGDGVTLTYYEVGIAADVTETVVGGPSAAAPASYTPTPQAPPAAPQMPPAAPQAPPAAPQMPPAAPQAPPPVSAAPPTDIAGMPVAPSAIPSAPPPPPPVAQQQVPPVYTIPPAPLPQDELPVEGEERRRPWLWIGCVALVVIVACVGIALVVTFLPAEYWLELERLTGIQVPRNPFR